MRLYTTLGVLLLASPAMAQQASDRAPAIHVVGVASVSTEPDQADLIYWVTGEGKTADEASASLASKHKAIAAGLYGLLGQGTQLFSGEVSIIETRSPSCDGPGNYNNRPRLSEGACAITGYIASLQGTGRTRAIEKAGTAAGLAARLGARDARVQGFRLSNPAEAQRRATAAAIADARSKAEAMAAGANVRLGELTALNDQNLNNDIVVRASLAGAIPAPSAPAAPPVEISLSPRPIETQARVYAQFAIAR